MEEMCNVEFLHKDPDEALEYISALAEKSNTWSGLNATDGSSRSRPTGVYHLQEEDNLKAQVENLKRKIDTL